MKNLLRSASLPAIVLICLLSGGCDLVGCPETMPDGYELQVGNHGMYRPTRVGRDRGLVWTLRPDGGTKCAAMKRAWRQYEFENNSDNYDWKTVDR